MRKPTKVRARRVQTLVALGAALILVGTPVVASADPTPTPGPTDALTSALSATGTVAQQVAAAQAAYAAATAHLTEVQNQLAAAVAAYGAAQDDLAARTAEADQATRAASALGAESDDADRALRQQAALLYQGSPTDSYLAVVFGPDGPSGLSDLQIGMAAVLARQDNTRIRALALASDAERMSERADAARAAQATVAADAATARTAVQAVVTSAEADTATIAAQQGALLARLAELRSTSAALEQQREDQLAALAGLPAGSSSAASLAKLYASGGGADLTKAQLDPQSVAKGMLVADGFAASEWPCLDMLWTAESGWNWSATNLASGAYGIPQALPGSKMASAGPDWLVNPVTQIRWGLTYIESRYGSPCATWAIWQARSPHWY
ncbi:MAG: hypothetical protein ABI131_00130 [Nostocoides sp.]